KRRFGVSKFGLERYARGFFDLLTVIFITTYLNRPMHLFGWVAALFFALGATLFSYLFFGRWLGGESIGTSPLFSISIFLMSTGIQVFVVGTVAELIVYNRERERLDSYSIREEDR
ncbi:MAG: glycosyltransferase, partial [Desulfofustis sp.]|nr:glycosyltransferase [Desulfofustis sp.]